MLLIIQTALSNRIQLALVDAKITHKLDKAIGFHESEILLGLANTLLQEASCAWSDIKGIVVALGPGGSFTALRLGVVLANTLAWSLKIPNVGIEGADLTLEQLHKQGKKLLETATGPTTLQPSYGRPPTITKPREK